MGTHAIGPPKLGRYHLLESVSSKTFTPREYQVELLDAAKKKNTIVCLGTGAGKTFIGIMLIKEFAFQTRKCYEKEDGKRTVFLVPTGALVYQQAKIIQDYTDLRVTKWVGQESCTDIDVLVNSIKENEVIVSTPDIFKMILLHGYISLSRINLLIFDECHRAVKNHAYCEVMRCFDVCPVSMQPQILGLSASLVNNKCKPTGLEHQIKTLESTMMSTVETASALTMLSRYGSKPQELLVLYESYVNNDEYFLYLLDILNSALMFLDDVNVDSDEVLMSNYTLSCKQIRRYLVELSHIVVTLGPWCTMQATSLFLEEIYGKLQNIFSDADKMYLQIVLTTLHQVEVLCQKMFQGLSKAEYLLHYSPPKLKRLLNILERFKTKEGDNSTKTAETYKVKETNRYVSYREYKKGKNINGSVNKSESSPSEQYKRNSPPGDGSNYKAWAEETKSLCCLVFVRQRITAYLLNLWLCELSKHYEEYKFISSSYIIGHGKINSSSKAVTLESHKQDDVLRRFKSREFNIIITTSVIEEGLDITKCNLVIRFDTPENFRAYLQSKGRARATDSFYVLMVNSDEKDKFIDDLVDFKTIDQILLKRSHKSDTADDEVLENHSDDLIEPYMPHKEVGAPRVTLSSAIALVNKYCAKLPSDTFTRLTPKWNVKEVPSVEDNTSLFQCNVQLPINSPLKWPIAGDVMKSKQLAKMAAGLKICIELHKIGELDDNLQPAGKETVKVDEDFRDDGFDFDSSDARPGTTKRRQYYFKQVADTLKGAIPVQGQKSYLYHFRMVLTCPIPEEQNTRGRKIHDPGASSRTFGVILSKPIPPICSFPVFTRSGEVTIYIDFVASDIILNDDDLDQLAFFHRYVFSDVLRLEKYPMKFDPLDAELSVFVVPLNTDGNKYFIDWEFVQAINKQKDVKLKRLTNEERQYFHFKDEDYVDAVVMPWYRNLDKPQFFYVAEICSSLTPLSNFPDEGFGSFKGYYEKKYTIAITNLTQPLLDVDHTSARLNLLTPRYVNRKGVILPTSSESTKKSKRENLEQKQILIPELCIIHPFPGSLWRKAVCLPCILYRINSLLLAEQLRYNVAKDIGVGISRLPSDFIWPMLDFGWTLADVIKAQATSKISDEHNADSILPVQSSDTNANYATFDNQSNNLDIIEFVEEEPACVQGSAFNDNSDFKIDVFDPTTCVIPDDDDLIEQELMNINFNMDSDACIPISNMPMWQSSEIFPKPSHPQVRYGSPSSFENNQWDTQIENTSFFSLNASGLGFISAPGVFNVESLSLDLATQKVKKEAWDSFEECSVISDDESSSDIKDGLSENDFCVQDGCDELNLSEWLSNCSLPAIEEDVPVKDTEDLDESVCNSIATMRENKKSEIQFLTECSSDIKSEKKETSHSMFKNFLSAVSQIEDFKETVIENFENNSTPLFKPDWNSSSDDTKERTTSGKSTLAFGELLPNRDEHSEESHSDSIEVVFDESPDLSVHPGPSPSVILQALTMSNANDSINLERLETVGDSFLKYAITAYLFCTYPNIHEGKLSYLRSKQISNLNLYRLGRRKGLGEIMVASKFEPNDNYLPPGYTVPKGLEQALIESGCPSSQWNINNMNNLTDMTEEEIRECVKEKQFPDNVIISENDLPLVPYNLLTQHSIPDKSIADCVEACIGAYLVAVGSRGALLFMSWLGLKVLPASLSKENGKKVTFGYLDPPATPLLNHVSDPDLKLKKLLSGYASFEDKIGYHFKDKSYLLQAFTHASYYYNTLTDCYQRLEFLGDAVLDYLITMHLYKDPKKHSPGTLTDLRSALVNNTFFASLAVKYEFHKYFKAISPSLFNVINRFVELKEHSAIEDYADSYYLEEDECEEREEVEVPKALGDIFESVAGALYLDSNMSLDSVWHVYFAMMKPEIEYFSCHVPKSPIRELLELEPQTAKFEKAEMTLSGKVRVQVEVFGKGHFVGIGRNKRIAKCTAAKRALRELKRK